jgi:hypothetical protein
MTLEHNIAMRKAAEELVKYATTEYGRDERFWEVVRNHAVTFAPMPPSPPATIEPLSDEAARAFGRQVINFGQYAHQRYDDVPLGYLEWLADRNIQLVRYIRSRRVQSEMVTREEPTEEQDR